jgi:hypothetical protein
LLTTGIQIEKLTAVYFPEENKLLQKLGTQLVAGEEDQLGVAFLPSLVMKYELNSKQNLRLSKTYTPV